MKPYPAHDFDDCPHCQIRIELTIVVGPQKQHPRRAVGFRFFVQYEDGTIQEITTMALTLSVVQKCRVTAQPVDKKGNPAPVDGPSQWSAFPEGIVSLSPSADGLSCDVTGMDVGNTQITITADADLSAAVKPINGTLDVTVIEAQAVGFQISTGPVIDQARR